MKKSKGSKNPSQRSRPAATTANRTVKRAAKPAKPRVIVRTTDRRSWIVLAITGFGALLLRYMRIVRGKGHRLGLI